MAAKPLAVTVLAAGEGRRFHSSTPKVLHRAAGLPLLHHVLRTVHALAGVDRTIVVAGAEKGQVVDGVRATWPEVVFVDQAAPLGTAHALAQCEGVLQDFDGDLLVIPADTPLLRGETLQRLLDEHRRINADVTLLTACLDDPTGYGRVLRGFADGRFRVVEEADAGPDERAVREVSTGIWCFDKVALFRALERVGMDNAQGEYYLPDGAWVISEQGGRTHTVMAADPTEVRGVNDRAQLAEAARELRARHLGQLMASGVTIEDPVTTYIDDGVEIGADTTIRPLTFLEGSTKIGRGATIGPAARIVDSTVEDGAEVSFAVVLGSAIGAGSKVGPFASLRPGTRLGAGAKIGTFVEAKGSTIGEGSKVPHLSYVGDAEIGAGVNVGAGTITCNYDGETGKKSKTVIEDGVLIGSDTMLIAPVRLGKDAVTGAGSLVNKDIGPGEVAVGVPARSVRKRKPRPARE